MSSGVRKVGIGSEENKRDDDDDDDDNEEDDDDGTDDDVGGREMGIAGVVERDDDAGSGDGCVAEGNIIVWTRPGQFKK